MPKVNINRHVEFIAKLILYVGSGLILGMSIIYYLGYRINMTHSIPYGIYKNSKRPIDRNIYISFCPPDTKAFRIAKQRSYIPTGFCPNGYALFMKKVVGIPGDSYSFTMQGLILNGELLSKTKPLEKDAAKRELPVFIEKGILKPNEYILMGREIPNSFDARYFGLIRKEYIKNTLDPILIKRNAENV